MSSENYRIEKQDGVYFSVKTGLVARAEDCLYSSARNYAELSSIIEIDMSNALLQTNNHLPLVTKEG